MAQTINIETLQNTNDSARIYKWDIKIEGSFIAGDGVALFNGRCSSTDVPNPTHNVIDINVRGFTKKETGAVDWNPITFTIYEVQSYDQLQNLYNLANNSQFNYKDGTQQNKFTYSTKSSTIQIDLTNLQDSRQKTWKLHGCIMETYAPPQMSADKGAAVEIPITVHYDYAQLQ